MKQQRLFLLLLLSSLLRLSAAQISSRQCDPCSPLPEDLWLPPSVPARHINLTKSCPRLEDHLNFVHRIPEHNNWCLEIQTLSELCGKCIDERAGQPHCTICQQEEQDGQHAPMHMAFPDKTLPEAFSHPFQNQIPTCRNYNLYLKSMKPTNPICTSSQEFLHNYCGCQRRHPNEHTVDDSPAVPPTITTTPCQLCPHDTNILDPSRPIRIPSLPFETCSELHQATFEMLDAESELCRLLQGVSNLCSCPSTVHQQHTRCNLCSDGSTLISNYKLVPFFQPIFFNAFVPTCDMLQAYALNYPDDHDRCRALQQYGTYCGCPAVENHCESPCEELDEEFAQTELVNEPPQPALEEIQPTCETLRWSQFQIENTSDQCRHTIEQMWQCGCDQVAKPKSKEDDYKSYTNDMVRIGRVVGWISLVVSSLVISEIISAQVKLTITFYQIVLWMAIFDFATAVVWIVGPDPSECKTQGFFRQWGQTSIFMSGSLSLFYYLVIVRGWKEASFRPFKKYLIGIPLTLGTILAFASLQSMASFPYGCHPDRSAAIGFITIPIYISTNIVWILTGSTLHLHRQRQQPHSSRRGSHQTKARVEGEAVWQGVWFAVAFTLTWPLWGMAVFLRREYPPTLYTPTEYDVWHVVVLVAPLTGTTNGLTYFWPRLLETNRNIRRNWNRNNDNYEGEGEDADDVLSSPASRPSSARRLRRLLWRVFKGTKTMARKAGELTGEVVEMMRPRKLAASKNSTTTTGTPPEFVDGEVISVLHRSEDDEDDMETYNLNSDDGVTSMLRPII